MFKLKLALVPQNKTKIVYLLPENRELFNDEVHRWRVYLKHIERSYFTQYTINNLRRCSNLIEVTVSF